MRIAHVSLCMDFYPGIARMRGEEARAAAGLAGGTWHTWVVSPHEGYARDGVRVQPLAGSRGAGADPSSGGLRFFLARALTLNHAGPRLRFVRFLNELAGRYDLLLVRYNPADLVSWAALRHREKIVFVHHSKAVPELAAQSALGALAERLTGPLQMRGTPAVCGVTPEIAEHEAARVGEKPWLVLPNGVHADPAAPLPDERRGAPKIVMISSDFRSWQGLDLALDRIRREGSQGCELHLAGRMTDELRHRAEGTPGVHLHGLLDDAGVAALLAGADLSLGSLAVFRKGLRQVSALKTRTSLAHGVPVAGGCEDAVFPADFPHYRDLGADWAWADVARLAREARSVPRREVFEAAAPCIDSGRIMAGFVDEVRALGIVGA